MRMTRAIVSEITEYRAASLYPINPTTMPIMMVPVTISQLKNRHLR